jgi:PIN domain nuclease of toxin-antitoxin system
LKYLLDTHTVLWWLFNQPQLSPLAQDIISDAHNDIFVSSASSWEIATKFRLGKLPSANVLVQDIKGWITRARFFELPITIEHAQRAGSWPQKHRDPFDRMLAAQSAIEDWPLIGCDAQIQGFGIKTIW